jgi:hypothetical protein
MGAQFFCPRGTRSQLHARRPPQRQPGDTGQTAGAGGGASAVWRRFAAERGESRGPGQPPFTALRGGREGLQLVLATVSSASGPPALRDRGRRGLLQASKGLPPRHARGGKRRAHRPPCTGAPPAPAPGGCRPRRDCPPPPRRRPPCPRRQAPCPPPALHRRPASACPRWSAAPAAQQRGWRPPWPPLWRRSPRSWHRMPRPRCTPPSASWCQVRPRQLVKWRSSQWEQRQMDNCRGGRPARRAGQRPSWVWRDSWRHGSAASCQGDRSGLPTPAPSASAADPPPPPPPPLPSVRPQACSTTRAPRCWSPSRSRPTPAAACACQAPWRSSPPAPATCPLRTPRAWQQVRARHTAAQQSH